MKTIESAIDHACKMLPTDWDILVCLERGATTVILAHKDAMLVTYNDDKRTLAEKIEDAIDTALAEEAEG